MILAWLCRFILTFSKHVVIHHRGVVNPLQLETIKVFIHNFTPSEFTQGTDNPAMIF